MYDDDDLTVLDLEAELESPLDRMGPIDAESETPKPNPEAMLALLDSSETNQRMLAARAFCELQDERAITKLIDLLQDACTLVRVGAAYGLGQNPSNDAVEPLIDQLNRDWKGTSAKVWFGL